MTDGGKNQANNAIDNRLKIETNEKLWVNLTMVVKYLSDGNLKTLKIEVEEDT